MEKLVNIIEQTPLQQRRYRTPQGEEKTFVSVGFTLSDGMDTFHAELTGDRALTCGTLDPNTTHMVQLQWKHRTWKDQNGEYRHENRAYINSIV